MSTMQSRFALRLLVPLLAVAALAALGEPLDASADAGVEASAPAVVVIASGDAELVSALEYEAMIMRQEADVAKKVARRAAAQMRWFLTLPAASASRCNTPGCTGMAS